MTPRAVARVLVSTACVTTMAACGGSDASGPAEATADCTQVLRYQGVTYRGFGYTERKAQKIGTAELADCEDVGEGARGSVFPETPDHTVVWSFDGVSADQAVGVTFGEPRFAVFVATSLSEDRQDALLDELSPSQ